MPTDVARHFAATGRVADVHRAPQVERLGERCEVGGVSVEIVALPGLARPPVVKGATLKIYEGGSHGMCTTNKDAVNADLLAFLKS